MLSATSRAPAERPVRLRGPSRPDFLRDELLHELFQSAAARAPESVALRCQGSVLRYGELLGRSTRMARFLRSQGICRGERVVLLMPRGVDMFVAVLGVLQAGASYVPLDPECPMDRVAYVVGDCGARCLVTSGHLAASVGPLPCRVVVFDEEEAEMAAYPSEPLTRAETELTPDDCAYIIYTSGSTGRPKGVMISHRSVCHFVRSEGSILDLRADDVVFQGFSLSFDMSVEEIWPAWAAGAALLVGTAEMMRAGGDLAAILAREGLTVWTCVPTLLAMQETSVPSLRLLNLGGEACPPELLRRFARPGLRVLNTYGPTETTVTATAAELDPERPVTIGRPLPNYSCYLLDADLVPVAFGQVGELLIGGPGLALGYVGRPDLTAEKFIPNPLGEEAAADDPLLYRTGDLVRLNASGEIEYLGRIDTQVKIRGFRVELTEIEAVILQAAPVRNAVVSLHQDGQEVDTLVAYLVPANGAIDEQALRARLKERLPAYMVPTIFETVSALPTLPSGKVDRKNLPKPTRTPLAAERVVIPPVTATEIALHAAWCAVFALPDISVEDDFFLDLGGHSLRAATMVSLVRKQGLLGHISMVDVYRHPTIFSLAGHLEATRPAAAEGRAATAASAREEFVPVPRWRYWACAAAQGLSLVSIFAVFSLQWLIPYLAYAMLSNWETDKRLAIAVALTFYVVAIPVMLVIGIAVKWLVIGRLRPGEYPLWGAYYFRWWLVNRVLDTVPTQFLGGTPLMAVYYRLLGARVGRNVYLRDDTIDAPDCVEIGDDSSFSAGATLSCWKVENGKLKIGRIRVGRGCLVGASSAITAGAVIGDGAEIEDLSMVPPGTSVPAGEVWGGSPARYVGRVAAGSTTSAPASVRLRFAALFSVLLLIFPIFAITPVFPGMILMAELDQDSEAYNFLLLSPVLAVVFVLGMCLQIAALKWLLVGRVKPQRYPVLSLAYVRYWLADKLMELSLDIVNPLYATIYLNPWYRLLGVKLGARAEVSTASSIGFDTLRIGEESFIADAVTLGVPRVHRGELEIKETEIGRRAFIGNCAVVPAGTRIGDGVLVGVLSTPPRRPEDALRPDSSWFGTPAVFLPQRQTHTQLDAGSTFHPRWPLVAQRALIEFVRIILPLTCLIALTSMMMSYVVTLDDDYDWSIPQIAAVFPLLYLAYASVAALFVVALKWLVVGRYRPVEKPLWNQFVWRSELVTAAYENLAAPLFADLLRGTPFLPAYLRLLGCKIGRRVYLDTTDFTEFDVISIGDDAALNSDSGPQTHLFEDRVMKISKVEIGARCTIGGGSIVLYDARMEEDSALGDLSLVMKGETLPAATEWEGSPARRVPARHSSNL